jgi:hypothetical protein
MTLLKLRETASSPEEGCGCGSLIGYRYTGLPYIEPYKKLIKNLGNRCF